MLPKNTLYPIACRLICAVSRLRFFAEFFGVFQTGFSGIGKNRYYVVQYVFRPPETLKKQYDSSVFRL